MLITPLATAADEDDAYLVAQASATYELPDVPFASRESFAGQISTNWPGTDREHYLARTAEGVPVAYLSIMLPQLESVETATLGLVVHPDHRRQGIGRALYDFAVDRARALNRRYLISPTVDRLPDGPAFAVAMGAAPGLAEVRSRLDVTDFDALGITAAEVADGYHLVQWTNHAPEEYLDDLAYLESRLLEDSPTGDLAWEPEKVDAARIREAETAILARNRTAFHTGAVHTGTGRLVAWTEVACPNDVRWQAWQQITLVEPAHRGHGLGLAVKVANLIYLRAARPELRAVDTFNAEENVPMLRVNESMGFHRGEVWTQWQATLGEP